MFEVIAFVSGLALLGFLTLSPLGRTLAPTAVEKTTTISGPITQAGVPASQFLKNDACERYTVVARDGAGGAELGHATATGDATGACVYMMKLPAGATNVVLSITPASFSPGSVDQKALKYDQKALKYDQKADLDPNSQKLDPAVQTKNDSLQFVKGEVKTIKQTGLSSYSVPLTVDLSQP